MYKYLPLLIPLGAGPPPQGKINFPGLKASSLVVCNLLQNALLIYTYGIQQLPDHGHSTCLRSLHLPLGWATTVLLTLAPHLQLLHPGEQLCHYFH